jgi:hypothetical protein
MTHEEKATIYGQAMLELRECNSDIAAFSAYFSNYAERLTVAINMAKRFASDPLAIAADQIPFSEHAKNENLRLTRADFGDKVDELVRLTRRRKELKAQVDSF